MAAQIKSANANSASLSKEVTSLKKQLAVFQEAAPGGQLQEALLSQSSSSGSISNDIFADANRWVCGADIPVTYQLWVCHFGSKRPQPALLTTGVCVT